jgi:hypothetical protein
LPNSIGLPVLAHVPIREDPVRAVVEDVAVLENLDEGRAAMEARLLDDALDVIGLRVDRAGHEARLGREGDHERVDRVVDRADGGRLRLLAEL